MSLAGFANNVATGTGLKGARVIAGYSVTTDMTWNNLGMPYVVDGSAVTIGNGVTLTLAPGVVIKAFGNGGLLHVDDRENRRPGTASQPIRFTSLKDDTVAGDTNGDGSASIPAPGDWSLPSPAASFWQVSAWE